MVEACICLVPRRGLELAHPSGLRVHYSDGYHDWRHGYDAQNPRYRANPRIAAVNRRYSAAAGSLAPMQMFPLTFHDFATGHDPVMAAMPFLLA